MKLSTLTNENLIVLGTSHTKKADVIQTLIHKLYTDGKITSEEEFSKVVYDRESLSETGMEAGLAIPHGKSTCVKEAAFAVMSTKEVVTDWESLDPSNEVQYIFLLAIPEAEAGSTHLELLAALMERMSDDDYKKKIFASKTIGDFLHNLDADKIEDTTEVTYTKTIVAITACPAGIAHTYMAAEALIKAGKEMGVEVLVEKQGANGIEGRHSQEDLKRADAAIFAVGVSPKEPERFSHLAVTQVPVATPLKDAKAVITKALEKAEAQGKGQFVSTETKDTQGVWATVKQSVMTGISFMIPLIVAGGMLGAFAVMANNLFGLDVLYNDPNSWLGMIRTLASGLLSTLLIPVLSAYMAYSIGDKTALCPGFAAGLCANLVQGGFLAGMAGGLLAGYLVLALKKYCPAKGTMAGFISFWVYPVVSTTLIALLMFLVIGQPIAWVNTTMINFLQSLSGVHSAILGAVLGIMVSFDLGGPVNKAAYTFCAGAIAEGFLIPYAVFASAKMVSGFAITMTTGLAPKHFKPEDKDIGKSTWILALAGITEGAIPFMMRDPLNVMISLCSGSAVTGAIVALCNMGLDVPGAGIFSIFMLKDGMGAMMNGIIWVGAALVGAFISTIILVALRKWKTSKVKGDKHG